MNKQKILLLGIFSALVGGLALFYPTDESAPEAADPPPCVRSVDQSFDEIIGLAKDAQVLARYDADTIQVLLKANRELYARNQLLEAFMNDNGIPTPADDATLTSLKLN